MTTEAIEEFTLNGRTFTVLWDETSTYLRADGRTWAALGTHEAEDAIRLAHIQAEIMVLEERAAERQLIHQFYMAAPPEGIAEAKSDYALLTCEAHGQAFPVVWADFNQNTYVCVRSGWQFVATADSAEDAVAAVSAHLDELPAKDRQPGRPNREVTAPGQPFPWKALLELSLPALFIAYLVWAVVS